MNESITQQGILVHVDLADSCRQGDKIGLVSTDVFYLWLEEQLRERFSPHGFEFVKSMGDACLFFGQKPETLPALVLDLFTRQPIPKRFGFQVELRAVAGSGWFQLRPGTNRKYCDAIGPEVNKVFRLDKHGKPDHFLVRSDLRDPIAHLLPQWGITEEEVQAPPLKGFEKYGPVLCFLLKPPAAGLRREPMPEPFERARTALRQETQQVHVLGGLARETSMDSGFIDLKLEAMTSEAANSFTACNLFDRPRHGLIFGPPGCGKTTILRYYAFRTLEQDQDSFLMLVRGGDFAPEDIPAREAGMEEVWQTLAAAFLFPARPKSRRTPGEQTAVETTAGIFQNAWDQGLVVLLIDDLSELAAKTQSDMAPANLLRMIDRLFTEMSGPTSNAASKKDNRVFAAVPASEERNLELRGLPSFRVKGLALEEVAQLAENIYRVTPELTEPFREAMGHGSSALFLAGTPQIATLAILYFQHYQTLPLRYGAYDLMMRFLIGNVQHDLENANPRWVTPGALVEEITSTVFLTRNTEMRAYYDALSSLCHAHLYLHLPRNNESVIPDRVCLDFFANHLANAGMAADRAATEARTFFDRLCEQHVLSLHRPGSHIFVNSDLIQFLAARHLANMASSKEQFAAAVQQAAVVEGAEALEVLPLLCGSKSQICFQTLEALRSMPAPPAIASSLPFRCMAETEALLAKLNLGVAYADPADPRTIALRQWIRDSVTRLLMNTEAGPLRQWADNYKSSLPLPPEDFPNTLGVLRERSSPELVEARKMTLEKLFSAATLNAPKNFPPLDSAAPPAAVAAEEILLTLDKPGHPDDKNFAYQAQQLGPGLIGLLGSPNLLQAASIRAVAIAPEGFSIASGSTDGAIHIWDARTGREILALRKHTAPIEACVWSPKGNALASASSDGSVIIWEMPSGAVRHILNGVAGTVNSCAWSPDGLWLATAWADKTVQIWDALTKGPARKLAGHQSAVTCCAWSPDGKLLLSGSWDQTLRIWSPQSGASLATISGMTGPVKACVWSPDSKKVASVSQQSLKIHELPGGREIFTLTGHTGAINSCAWSRDGQWLATASADRSVKIWEVSSASERLTLQGHRGSVEACAWAPDGNYLVSASADASIRVWEMPEGKERFHFNGHRAAATGCAWSPDGGNLVSSSRDETLKIWAWPSGTEARTLTGHKTSVDTCAWSADGTTLASGSRDNTIKLWAMPEGKENMTLAGHTGRISACAWSPKDGTLATASWDHTVRLWETSWGKEIRILTGHQDSVFACAWSPSGEFLATGSGDRSLKIWDPATGKAINSWTRHQGAVECCVWAPDGKRLATGASDGIIKLWNMPDGASPIELAGHKKAVLTCAWSIQGNLLVSGSQDQTIKIWDVVRGQELLTLSLDWTPRHIQFAPTRPYEFAVASEAGMITLFDAQRALQSRAAGQP